VTGLSVGGRVRVLGGGRLLEVVGIVLLLGRVVVLVVLFRLLVVMLFLLFLLLLPIASSLLLLILYILSLLHLSLFISLSLSLFLFIFSFFSFPLDQGIKELHNVIDAFDIAFYDILSLNLQKILLNNLLLGQHEQQLINGLSLIFNPLNRLKLTPQLGVDHLQHSHVPIDVG